MLQLKLHDAVAVGQSGEWFGEWPTQPRAASGSENDD
jgi:hypothetical protein